MAQLPTQVFKLSYLKKICEDSQLVLSFLCEKTGDNLFFWHFEKKAIWELETSILEAGFQIPRARSKLNQLHPQWIK